MKVFFVIGGIGSGKSTVAKLLAILGAKSINLDKLGHQALKDERVIKKLTSSFGKDILDGRGIIDRKRLATQAFQNTEKTLELDRITFPKIEELLKREIAEQEKSFPEPIIVVEASSYDPSKLEFKVKPDGIIAVVAPEETRIARAVKAGFDEEDAVRRNSLQPTDNQRRSWADHVIENDSTFEDLERQVANLWDEL